MLEIEIKDNNILLKGAIEEQDLIEKNYPLNLDHNNNESLTICCENLTQINSLSIAWLIACWRYFSQKKIQFTLQNIPKELQRLIQLYRLDQVLRSQ